MPMLKVSLLISVFIFSFHKAIAFGSDGHKKIEKTAYDNLKRRDPMHGLPDGKTIVSYLISNGFLAGSGSDPKVLSSYPDISPERQFYQKLQPYHFMASNKAVKKAAEQDGWDARQKTLLQEALPDNLKLTYFLFDELINYPTGSKQSGRGLYVLMHIIVDSYSNEHTARDSNGNIVAVKGWRTNRLFWPDEATERLNNPNATNGKRNMPLLHRGLFTKNGDEDWKICGTEDSLSTIGNKATEAIEELLKAAYKAHLNPDQIDPIWDAYAKSFLQPATGDIPFTYRNELTIGQKDKMDQHGLTAYTYDRHIRHSASVSFQFPDKRLARNFNPGFNYHFNFSPWDAASPNPLKRLPLSLGGELLFIKNSANAESDGNDFSENLKLKVTPGLNLSIFNNMPFRMYAIGSLFPLVSNQEFSLGYGIEISRLDDWLELPVKSIAINLRPAIAYERDPSGFPAKHNICLRIGLSTWHTRLPKNK